MAKGKSGSPRYGAGIAARRHLLPSVANTAMLPFPGQQQHRQQQRNRPAELAAMHAGGGDALGGLATSSSFMEAAPRSPMPQRACASATAASAATGHAPFQSARPLGVPTPWNAAMLDSMESQSPSTARATAAIYRSMPSELPPHRESTDQTSGRAKGMQRMQQHAAQGMPARRSMHSMAAVGPQQVSGVDMPMLHGGVMGYGRLGGSRAGAVQGSRGRTSMGGGRGGTVGGAGGAGAGKAAAAVNGAELYHRQQRAVQAAVQAATQKQQQQVRQVRRRQSGSARVAAQRRSRGAVSPAASASSRSATLAPTEASESQMLHESLQETLQEALDGIGTRWSEMHCFDQAEHIELLRALQERHAASLRALEDTCNQRLKVRNAICPRPPRNCLALVHITASCESCPGRADACARVQEELDAQANVQAQQLIQVLEAHQTALSSVHSTAESAATRSGQSPAHSRQRATHGASAVDHAAWVLQQQRRNAQWQQLRQAALSQGHRGQRAMPAVEPDSPGTDLGGGDSSFMGFDTAGTSEREASGHVVGGGGASVVHMRRQTPARQARQRNWQRQLQLEGWPEEELAVGIADSLADAAAVRAELEGGFRDRMSDAALDSTPSDCSGGGAGNGGGRGTVLCAARRQQSCSDGGSPDGGQSATVRLRKMQSLQSTARGGELIDPVMSHEKPVPVM